MDEHNDVERELQRILTEGELPDEAAQQKAAIKRLPPRWIAVARSSFHQVEEATKKIRSFISEAEDLRLKKKRRIKPKR
jgi:DnaJ-domain-containing protein 1